MACRLDGVFGRAVPESVCDTGTAGRWATREGRAPAVAGHREAHGEAAPIREPFGHHGDRSRIAEAGPETDHHAEPEVKPAQALCEGAREEPAAHEQGAGNGDPEGPEAALKPSRQNEPHGERGDGDGEGRRGLRAMRPAEPLLQGRDEHTPSVQKPRARFIDRPPAMRHQRLSPGRVALTVGMKLSRRFSRGPWASEFGVAGVGVRRGV